MSLQGVPRPYDGQLLNSGIPWKVMRRELQGVGHLSDGPVGIVAHDGLLYIAGLNSKLIMDYDFRLIAYMTHAENFDVVVGPGRFARIIPVSGQSIYPQGGSVVILDRGLQYVDDLDVLPDTVSRCNFYDGRIYFNGFGYSKSCLPDLTDIQNEPDSIIVNSSIDTDNDIGYVYGSDEVLAYNLTSKVNTLGFGSTGTGNGQFNAIANVAFYDGEIFVIEGSNTPSDNHRVQVFDDTGGYLRQWGSYGENTPGEFDQSQDIAVDDGFVFTVQLGGMIQKFDIDGNLLAYINGVS